MNIFNRIVLVVLAITAVVAGLVLASAPDALLAAIQNWTRDATVTATDRIASAVLGVGVALVGIVALYLELRPRRGSSVVIKRLPDGTVSMEVTSIARGIREAVEALPGVRQAIPEVHSRGRDITVRVTILADATVDIPAKSEEVGVVVRETVAKMGVGLTRQTVHVRYDPAAVKTRQQA